MWHSVGGVQAGLPTRPRLAPALASPLTWPLLLCHLGLRGPLLPPFAQMQTESQEPSGSLLSHLGPIAPSQGHSWPHEGIRLDFTSDRAAFVSDYGNIPPRAPVLAWGPTEPCRGLFGSPPPVCPPYSLPTCVTCAWGKQRQTLCQMVCNYGGGMVWWSGLGLPWPLSSPIGSLFTELPAGRRHT